MEANKEKNWDVETEEGRMDILRYMLHHKVGQSEMAKKLGVPTHKVSYWNRKYNIIPIRKNKKRKGVTSIAEFPSLERLSISELESKLKKQEEEIKKIPLIKKIEENALKIEKLRKS